MKRVLLISMPFASVRYPSAALSVLKPLVEKEGVACDVAYLNVAFQAYVGRPEVYEAVADLILMGEWVFGEALFGSEWGRSARGGVGSLTGPLLPQEPYRDALRAGLTGLRSLAGKFVDACLDRLDWNYDLIGFSSVFSQHVASLALAKGIKERWPEKTVVFGGANCMEEMGETLLRLFPFVDWVVTGEGDYSFPEALRRRLSGRSPEGVPGVLCRNGDGGVRPGSPPVQDLNELPYPDFGDYFHALSRWAVEYLPSAPISLEFSRGCWWGKKSQCVFCGLNCKAVRYRSKKAGRAEDEIRTLTQRYGVDRVMLTDSVINMGFLNTLFPSLAEWGGLEELFLESRPNLTSEQLRLLRAAGVRAFQPGIESLDTEMLSYMRKGSTLLENVQFLKWARQYGMHPTWNLLYGFPGENPEAYHRMASLSPLLMHLSPPMDLSPVLFVRFSPLLDRATEWGLRGVRAHAGYRAIYPFEEEDLDGLAVFFEADYDGKEEASTYAAPLRSRVEAWKEAWRQGTPPSLTVFFQPGPRAVITDERPCSAHRERQLEGDWAAGYAACDAATPFASVAEQVRRERKAEYGGDAALRAGLEGLVKDGLMLSENDRYLSLAIQPGLEPEYLEI